MVVLLLGFSSIRLALLLGLGFTFASEQGLAERLVLLQGADTRVRLKTCNRVEHCPSLLLRQHQSLLLTRLLILQPLGGVKLLLRCELA